MDILFFLDSENKTKILCLFNVLMNQFLRLFFYLLYILKSILTLNSSKNLFIIPLFIVKNEADKISNV